MSLENQNENYLSIEEANFDGNDTTLLLERFHDPVIRRQVLELLSKSEAAKAVTGRRSRPPEELEHDYDQRLSMIETYTPVLFFDEDKDDTSGAVQERLKEREIIPVGMLNSITNERFTTKQMSILEAHEKGHVIRPYDSHVGNVGTKEFSNDWTLRNYFGDGFDVRNATAPPSEIELIKSQFGLTTDAEARGLFEKYLFSPMEIAERMSQLKNYFGLSGHQSFTKVHLDYARQHYVEDTGIDNYVSAFLAAITPETEVNFLSLINSSGI